MAGSLGSAWPTRPCLAPPHPGRGSAHLDLLLRAAASQSGLETLWALDRPPHLVCVLACLVGVSGFHHVLQDFQVRVKRVLIRRHRPCGLHRKRPRGGVCCFSTSRGLVYLTESRVTSAELHCVPASFFCDRSCFQRRAVRPELLCSLSPPAVLATWCSLCARWGVREARRARGPAPCPRLLQAEAGLRCPQSDSMAFLLFSGVSF